jgi:hypothetical protein
MRQMLACGLTFGIWVLCVLSLAGCCSTKSAEQSADPALVPVVNGTAAFVSYQSTKYVRFGVRGTHSCVGHPPSDITVKQIQLFGRPGRWGSDEVGVPTYLVQAARVPTAPERKWEVTPGEWDRTKLGWDAGAEYTLLLRYTYDLNESGHGTTQQTAERLWLLEPIVPSGFVNLKLPGGGSPGDTIANVLGAGTFFGSQGMALYDISFDITPPTGYRPSSMNVYAEPTSNGTMPAGFPNNPGDLVNPTPIALAGDTTHVSLTGLQGTYVRGSDTYYFRVVVTYTAMGQPPVTDTQDGTFTAINSQQSGGAIPLN